MADIDDSFLKAFWNNKLVTTCHHAFHVTELLEYPCILNRFANLMIASFNVGGEFLEIWVLVSAPYIKTDFTFVLKILLVLWDNSLDLHTGLSGRNAVLALPILTNTSCSVAPSTAITLFGCCLDIM